MSINRIDPSDLNSPYNEKHPSALNLTTVTPLTVNSLTSISEEQTVVQKADKKAADIIN